MKTKELPSILDQWLMSLKNREIKPISLNTEKTYRNAVNNFYSFMSDQNIDEIDNNAAQQYKQYLLEQKEIGSIKPSTLNARVTAINKFFSENNLDAVKIKVGRQIKRNPLDDTLEESDYTRMIRWAKKLNLERERLIMETLAGTGIRISELEYFTVEALKKATRSNPSIYVKNKGKERFVIIPAQLRKSLLDYAKKNEIKNGVIFHSSTDNNKLIDKAWIWRKLKMIAGRAKVKKSKVHCHSFRHLFAKRYMNEYHNLSELADLLGHESMETTRIYANESSKSKQNKLDRLIK